MHHHVACACVYSYSSIHRARFSYRNSPPIMNNTFSSLWLYNFCLCFSRLIKWAWVFVCMHLHSHQTIGICPPNTHKYTQRAFIDRFMVTVLVVPKPGTCLPSSLHTHTNTQKPRKDHNTDGAIATNITINLIVVVAVLVFVLWSRVSFLALEAATSAVVLF